MQRRIRRSLIAAGSIVALGGMFGIAGPAEAAAQNPILYIANPGDANNMTATATSDAIVLIDAGARRLPKSLSGRCTPVTAAVGVAARCAAVGRTTVVIALGDGDDTLDMYELPSRFTLDVASGSGTNLVVGGRGNDHLLGGPGNDRMYGGFGDNVMIGGTGAEVLKGGSGNDLIVADPRSSGGADLEGREGDDHIIGSAGDDYVIADAQSDTDLPPSAGKDRVEGLSGGDLIFGGGGADIVDGGSGDDFLIGDGFDPDDLSTGPAGGDLLLGGAGTDVLDGEGGSDRLSGGAGDESLIAEHGVKDAVDCGKDVDRSFVDAGIDVVDPSCEFQNVPYESTARRTAPTAARPVPAAVRAVLPTTLVP